MSKEVIGQDEVAGGLFIGEQRHWRAIDDVEAWDHIGEALPLYTVDSRHLALTQLIPAASTKYR